MVNDKGDGVVYYYIQVADGKGSEVLVGEAMWLLWIDDADVSLPIPHHPYDHDHDLMITGGLMTHSWMATLAIIYRYQTNEPTNQLPADAMTMVIRWMKLFIDIQHERVGRATPLHCESL